MSVDAQWAQGLAWAALALALLGPILLVLGQPTMQAPPGSDPGLFSELSLAQALIIVFGPVLLLALAGRLLYARLPEEARGRARVARWAVWIVLGVPLAIVLLYMIAMSTMGPA